MAIALRTVSINPAFLREIKDDHHELRQLVHQTSSLLETTAPTEVDHAELVEMLTRLRDQLAMHFSLEEAYGYFEDAIVEAPHLNSRADKLRGQHSDLFADMCWLVEAAEQLLYHEAPARRLTRLTQQYRDFLAKFYQHETLECDLILEAFNEDLGMGD